MKSIFELSAFFICFTFLKVELWLPPFSQVDNQATPSDGQFIKQQANSLWFCSHVTNFSRFLIFIQILEYEEKGCGQQLVSILFSRVLLPSFWF